MYSINVKKRVYKFIKSLENSEEIIEKLNLLKQFKGKERIRFDIERLQGQKSETYRLRIGEIRIIFQILKEQNTIYVKGADYRGRVYK